MLPISLIIRVSFQCTSWKKNHFLLELLGSYNAYSINQSFTLFQISPVNIFTNNLIAITRHSKSSLTWA